MEVNNINLYEAIDDCLIYNSLFFLERFAWTKVISVKYKRQLIKCKYFF